MGVIGRTTVQTKTTTVYRRYRGKVDLLTTAKNFRLMAAKNCGMISSPACTGAYPRRTWYKSGQRNGIPPAPSRGKGLHDRASAPSHRAFRDAVIE